MARPGIGGGERGTWLDIKEDQILRVGDLGSTDLAGLLLIRYVSAGANTESPKSGPRWEEGLEEPGCSLDKERLFVT